MKVEEASEFTPEALAERMNQREERVAKDIVEHAIAQGDDLTRTRSSLKKRKFAPWLGSNVTFSRQTAYTYIHIAKHKDAIRKATVQMKTLSDVQRYIDSLEVEGQEQEHSANSVEIADGEESAAEVMEGVATAEDTDRAPVQGARHRLATVEPAAPVSRQVFKDYARPDLGALASIRPQKPDKINGVVPPKVIVISVPVDQVSSVDKAIEGVRIQTDCADDSAAFIKAILHYYKEVMVRPAGRGARG